MRDGPIPFTPNGGDPLVGRVIAGKFAVDARLGAGAMGIVYRATQLALERTVAIKVLHRAFATDGEFAERFWREAKAASRLDHPNSIRVFDFGQEPDGLLYLAMEYVEGRDLFELISERGALPAASIVDVLSQVLAALAVAHDMAVVHRDLKPENIMIVRGKSDDGQAIDVIKVCDFGIAKILDPTAAVQTEPRRKHSTTGLVVGTPAYMSPEQARGEKLDARSDLYSVGVVLYELLTGKVPFEGESPLAVALRHLGENPRPPSALALGVEPDLESICLRALSKKPADRFQSAREMRLALQSAASKPGFGAQSRRASLAPSPGAQLARHDSGKPTFAGVTPATPPPQQRRSRAWLAVLLVPVACAWLFSRFHPSGAHDRARPAISAAPSAQVALLPSVASPDQSAESKAGSPGVSSVASVHAAFGGKPQHVSGAPTQPAAAQRDALKAVIAATAPAPAPAPVAEAALASPPPSLPASPAPALAPSPPSPAPVAPTYDLQAAHVAIGWARNTVGATASSVTRAVSEAASRITACYKAALPKLSGALEGTEVLHVDTDGAGIITDVRLSGPIRGSLASCVAAAVQGQRVANVDTGDASADVPLSFRSH